jgi:hypothetical protein
MFEREGLTWSQIVSRHYEAEDRILEYSLVLSGLDLLCEP